MSALKLRLIALFIVFTLGLSGCSSMKIEDFKDHKPELDLYDFFAGKTYAWGQFQNRSGQVVRSFIVDLTGTVKGAQLVLDEQFLYNDGERQQRIWTIKQTADKQYVGQAADIVGQAIGHSAGNALNWRYSLLLPYKDDVLEVQFNDWMFLHPNQTMLNRAQVSKFGFKVGEVTLFFSKQKPDNWQL